MSVTPKYSLEEVPAGTTNWNALLTANMQKLDAAVQTYLPGIAGESIAVGDACYLGTTGLWWKARANLAATMPALGLAVAAAAANGACVIQRIGLFTKAGWAWVTKGGLVYLSAAVGGGLTESVPTGTNQMQPIGLVASATSLMLLPGAIFTPTKIDVAQLRAGVLGVAGAGANFKVLSPSDMPASGIVSPAQTLAALQICCNSLITYTTNLQLTFNSLLTSLRSATGCGVFS